MTAFGPAGAPGRVIEDIYPLTALQQGMLFHTQAGGPGTYWVQHGLLLEGALDVGALWRAWEVVFGRHAVLRSAVVWEGVPAPVQVVSRRVPLPLRVVDCGGLEGDAVVGRYLAADREAGADFSQPSLVRLGLVRLGPGRWQLVWSFHHLLLDGWSIPLVLGEVLRAYHGLCAGREPGLGAVRPFRDYVAWAAAQEPGAAREYWRGYLAGLTAATSLGAERDTGQRGLGTCQRTVPGAGPAAAARRERVTVNTVVQGAWAVLMSVYSGDDEVLFGVTAAGRGDHVEGMESMVGLLITTTPARVRVDRDRPAGPWLRDLQREQARARQFEHTPLTDIQACSDVPAGQPLFSVVFVFENYPTTALQDGKATTTDTTGLHAQANLSGVGTSYPLTVAVSPGAVLSIDLGYDRSRFDDATIERMAGHLVTVLTALAEDPGRLVGDLPLLTTAERQQLLAAGAGPAGPVPAAGGVHELVAGRAAACPDAVAVVGGGAWLTYAGLEERANRLAHYLLGAGAGPETVVGLCLERGIEMVTAVLAVWKAGAAYLPLDPEYPAGRLAFMLADSRATVLVGRRDLAENLAEVLGEDLEVVWLDDPATKASVSASSDATMPGQMAYVVYTSGSTGTPKGVQVTHGGLVNYVTGMPERIGLGERGRRYALLQSSVTDFGNTTILSSLVTGGVLHILDAGMAAAPGQLAGYLAGFGIDYMKVVPSHLAALAGDGGVASLVPGRTLILGGEAASARWAGEVLAAAAGRMVANHYGPTETTIGVVSAVLGPELLADGVVPIGSPTAHTRVYVLDRHLALLPIGVAGELFIGGAGIARGYAGRPALTAEWFVADPFAGDGTRLYRTGDRVRWRADELLEFLGRADDQVKIRGFRVEPGEAEAVLADHPAVRAAVVLASEEGQDRRLVAYLVPKDAGGGIPPVSELREFAGRRLPEFMIPSVFIELAAIPLTSNGKVDRAALPALDGARQEPGGGYVAPRTPQEELLAGIWMQVLGISRVGVHDNFFELGGHSLRAIQAVSRIRTVFRVEFPITAFFDQPTIAGLAAVIEEGEPGGAAPAITPANRDEPLPLSFGQQRLWFLDRLEPGSAEYNVFLPVRLDGDMDVASLTAALGAMVARHEVLRTRLMAGNDGVPYQVIDPPSAFRLPVADVSGTGNPVAMARRLIAADMVTPFDLAAGPLIRGTLIRLAPDDHILTISMHHVVTDEWSVRIMRRELAALYQASRWGDPDPLPPLAVQYADFAVWQRRWLAGEVLDGQLAYWRDQLAGAPVLELPADRARPPVRSTAGGLVQFTIPADVTGRLREAARAGGATMFMTLLAAFAVLLSRYAGHDDVVVGTPAANRNRAETEGLIGFFVNTLVMRADLSGDPSFTVLLGRVRAMALAAYAHQDLPFEQLVDALVTDRDRSRTPLFQVLFNYLGGDGEEIGLDQESSADLEQSQPGAMPVKFDLSLTLGEPRSGELMGGIAYSTALFDSPTMERLVGHLGTLLKGIAIDAGQAVSLLPVLTEKEYRQLLWEWNETGVALPSLGGVHELITAQAIASPEKLAVVSDEGSLTYWGLEERANRLAHHLRRLGVGTETVVGLCLRRGTDMIVAMLAVWKSGAAYLPLDPGYPTERLAFMLTDSGAAALVGHREVAAGLSAAREIWLGEPDTEAVLEAAETAPPSVAVAPGQLAYVIYTSGSTGKPKGVQVTHGSLVNYVARCPDAYPGVRGVTLLHAPITFDAMVTTLYGALVSGGCVHVAGLDDGLIASRRQAELGPYTFLKITPALLPVLTGLPSECSPTGELMIGGDAAHGKEVQEWRVLNPGTVVIDHYGPTETTVGSTDYRIEPGQLVPAGALPVGRPVWNTRVLVVDRLLNPVPVGVPGELYIGGAGLARGYLGQPGLTAERFVADRFARDGSRVYRTGDLARWRADGQLQFLGRVDDQLKIRGFRVEPSEVEAVLTTHPQVHTAVVAVAGEGAQRRLVAYLVPIEMGKGIPSAGELRDFLRKRLPEFMVPAVFIELDQLPLTANGKLDRAALPAPDELIREGYVAPSTPGEELLARIWTEVLGVERAGVNDNFFELGGHSLRAIQMVSTIRGVFGVEISIATVFDQPTIAGLATVIESRIAEEIEQMSDDEVLQALNIHSEDPGSDEGSGSR